MCFIIVSVLQAVLDLPNFRVKDLRESVGNVLRIVQVVPLLNEGDRLVVSRVSTRQLVQSSPTELSVISVDVINFIVKIVLLCTP